MASAGLSTVLMTSTMVLRDRLTYRLPGRGGWPEGAGGERTACPERAHTHRRGSGRSGLFSHNVCQPSQHPACGMYLRDTLYLF